jgi:predicted transcriptional regulator
MIEKRTKNYEFRKYNPKIYFERVRIYSTAPTSCLTHVAIFGLPVSPPSKISPKGFGNEEFNSGKKIAKYAFPILHLAKLVHPITIEQLKKKYNISPPQRFTYINGACFKEEPIEELF